MAPTGQDPPDGLRVTKLRLDPAGFWRARVSVNGSTLDVDNRHGSWQTSGDGVRQVILVPVARVLQQKVRREEKRR